MRWFRSYGAYFLYTRMDLEGIVRLRYEIRNEGKRENLCVSHMYSGIVTTLKCVWKLWYALIRKLMVRLEKKRGWDDRQTAYFCNESDKSLTCASASMGRKKKIQTAVNLQHYLLLVTFYSGNPSLALRRFFSNCMLTNKLKHFMIQFSEKIRTIFRQRGTWIMNQPWIPSSEKWNYSKTTPTLPK